MNDMRITTLRLWLILGSLMASLILSGCRQRTFLQDEAVMIEAVDKKELPIELYVLEEVTSGRYEPQEGIYTGVYMMQNDAKVEDISSYEELVGQPQTFKVFHYTSEEGVSKQDILKCIANKKIPYIKLLLGKDYDLTPLYQLIFDLKMSYKVPVFVELYPLSERVFKVNEYKETYQRAYEILHKYLSDVTVVWSTDTCRVSDMALYYPGSGYVDWVGINIFIPKYKQGVRYEYDGMNQLDYWYKSFQEKKPLLISGLAISHYSTVDHAYAIRDTEERLTLFYDEILTNYPRLKGVIYMNVNMIERNDKGKEDYTLTGEKQLCKTLKGLSCSLKIQSTLKSESKKSYCYMKYAVKGILIKDDLYIPQEYMASCFKDIPLKKIQHVEDISGIIYYAYKDIKTYCSTYYKV